MTTETSNPNWWAEEDGFFGPEYLRQYDGTILTEKDTTHQVDFIEKVLETRGAYRNNLPMQFLDVPCGHGRHAIELASRTTDYQVTGYELNSHFLEKAKQLGSQMGICHPNPQLMNRLNFVQGDMRELPFENEFHVALNLFTAMGYFGDDNEDKKFFASVYRSLRTGGMFVVDYLNRDRIVKQFRANDWRNLPDGSVVLTEREYNILTGHMHDERVTLQDGKEVRRVTSSIRFYAPHELIAMAKRVGFILEAAYGDFDETPLTVESKRAILIFRKIV